MPTLTLAADDVSLLASLMPAGLLGPGQPLGTYDGTALKVSANLSAQVTAITADPNWRDSGAKAQLIKYAARKQAALMVGGISVNIGSSGSPPNIEASTDPVSLTLLQGAYAVAQGNSAATFQWVASSGASVTLTAAQIMTIFNAVTAFVQSTFTQQAAVNSAIASGAITTTAQVDTPPSPIPAWPAN